MYFSGFYPMHLALLVVGENPLPIAWWTPISKEPFRFLLAMDRRNWSLGLLRETREAALHFFDFADAERVVRAGYASGARVDKATRLGLELRPAERLARTRIVAGARCAFELTVVRELEEPEGDHVPFVCDVVHVHRGERVANAEPILFLGFHDFATLGARSRISPPVRGRRRSRRRARGEAPPGGTAPPAGESPAD
ncbi:MAG: flavin reductase family protein [Alphaproteobacteria bacterium]